VIFWILKISIFLFFIILFFVMIYFTRWGRSFFIYFYLRMDLLKIPVIII
jgi:hypothetical protein